MVQGNMQRIGVKTPGGAYDAVVEAGVLETAGEHLRPLVGERRLFVVADEVVWRHQGARLEKGLAGLRYDVLTTPAGEQRKRLDLVESLSERMHRAGADRSAVVLAFGGGVMGDVGGFVAASYMRGVDVIQIPTTLLAQVDAAVGGKTGVNLATGKNLVGAFHQPRLVLMDPTTLGTLPEREYRAGLFEVIKHGVIRSRELFDLMANRREAVFAREPDVLETMIAESVRIKAEVVSADERESGERRILNYGHTLGHALEAETEYRRFLHGEAVAYGMVAAGRLAENLEILSAQDRAAVEQTILSYGPIPSLAGIAAENLAWRTGGDKKTIGGHVHFVLAETIGKVRVVKDPDRQSVVAAARAALTFQDAAAPAPIVRERAERER